MQTKECATCGTDKPLMAFSNRASNSDGKHKDCKSCLYPKEANTQMRQFNATLVADSSFRDNGYETYAKKTQRTLMFPPARVPTYLEDFSAVLKIIREDGQEPPISMLESFRNLILAEMNKDKEHATA